MKHRSYVVLLSLCSEIAVLEIHQVVQPRLSSASYMSWLQLCSYFSSVIRDSLVPRHSPLVRVWARD